jgi:hypothetical protein
VELGAPGANTGEEGQRDGLRSLMEDKILYVITEAKGPLCVQLSGYVEAPVGSMTNLNGIEDQIYVLPCNVKPSIADFLHESTAQTAPA